LIQSPGAPLAIPFDITVLSATHRNKHTILLFSLLTTNSTYLTSLPNSYYGEYTSIDSLNLLSFVRHLISAFACSMIRSRSFCFLSRKVRFNLSLVSIGVSECDSAK